MKKVPSLQILVNAIHGKSDFQQDVNGKMYHLDFVSLLNMRLIDLIQMVKEGKLYYDEYYSMR